MASPRPPEGTSDDTRRAWAECEFDLWADVHPGFAAIHALEAALPEECLWLVAPQFDHGFWTTNTNTPSFTAFRAMRDSRPAHECRRRFVPVVQDREHAARVAHLSL